MAANQPTFSIRISLALIFAMVFPSFLAWLYFEGLSHVDGKPNPLQQGIYILGKTLQFAFPLGFVWYLTQDRLWIGPWNRRGLGVGIAFGLLVLIVMLLLYHWLLAGSWLIEPLALSVRKKMTEFGMDNRYRFLGLALFLTLIHSLLEEYYWRWFVFGWLRQIIPLWPAIVFSSLGFMAHHVLILNAYFPGRFIWEVVPFSLAIAVGGVFWAWMYHQYQSLLGPWISHLIVDAGLMWIGWNLLNSA